MLIRRAVIEDAEKLAAVHVQSWRETYDEIIEKDYLDGLNVEERVQFWSSRLTSPKNGLFVFVAENEAGELVGFASFGNERTQQYKIDSELMAIYILKKYKRGKIGTQLLFEGLKEMVYQGKNSLLVWVLANNPSR
jgi:L-amino acid N-acyltransferase YncA